MNGAESTDRIGELDREVKELKATIEKLHEENARAITVIDRVSHEIGLAISAANALSIAEGNDKMTLSIMSIKGLITEYDDGGESNGGN